MNDLETDSSTSAEGLSPARGRLCLALLVLLGFSLGVSEFSPIGIETDLAEKFGVSLQTCGQLISMYALAYAVMTPVLALSTGRFRRYTLLLAYSAIFCIGNAATVMAQSFGVLLAARILLGAVSGALLATGVTFIPELIGPKRASIGISVVYAAFAVAMVIITSVGKIVAEALDWHVVMVGTLVIAVVTCGACIAVLPRSGKTDEPASFREQVGLLGEPAVICGMLIFVFGIGSVYTFYGYVDPYLEQVLGLPTTDASLVLLIYGIICFFSNLGSGWLDMRFGIKSLVVAFLIQAGVLLGIWLAGPDVPVAIALIFCLALLMYLPSVSCISVFIGIANARHPKALTLASSLEPMSFNMGISFGTAVGGVVVSGLGVSQVGAVGAVLAVIASALAAVTTRLSRRRLAKYDDAEQ
jgi:DHA1 family inner membrane transport protein